MSVKALSLFSSRARLRSRQTGAATKASSVVLRLHSRKCHVIDTTGTIVCLRIARTVRCARVDVVCSHSVTRDCGDPKVEALCDGCCHRMRQKPQYLAAVFVNLQVR